MTKRMKMLTLAGLVVTALMTTTSAQAFWWPLNNGWGGPWGGPWGGYPYYGGYPYGGYPYYGGYPTYTLPAAPAVTAPASTTPAQTTK